MKKLKEINPILDISEHLIPVDLPELFGNSGDCALEIGFGDGDFLSESAIRQPGKNFLGIEVKKRRFNKAVKTALRKGLGNIKFLHIDANVAVGEIFYPDSFSTVYINFPDPWPKDRHQKHRIINAEFLEKLSRVMKRNAKLDIASDHKDYIFNALARLNNITFFESEYRGSGYLNHVPERPLTTYEREFREEGRKIYYLMFTNNK
ncbi:MAG: tRNA (guanosine(46)-N7)-methyltransferase TrmB [Deltaproteobacteria bacterium]